MMMKRLPGLYERPVWYISPLLTMLQVREGFIIDDDEEELDDRDRKSRGGKKRQRAVREEEEAVLDEEDLDLIGEANPEWERKASSQVSSSIPYKEELYLMLA
jgi:hypothetical protein